VAPVRKEEKLLIAVMGATGVGKSTFISRLARDTPEIGHSLKSCEFKTHRRTTLFGEVNGSTNWLLGTTDVAEFICDIDGKEVILLDTPGFEDTHRSDADILNSIADYMKEAGREGVYLSGLVYLHSISDVRMKGSSISNMRLFRALCGEDNLKKVIIATTKWEDTDPEISKQRFEELKDTTPKGVWSAYVAEGTQICRVSDNTASATALIRKLLAMNRQSFIPQIQREMMAGSTVAKTAAGMILEHKFKELTEKHEKEMQGVLLEQERNRRSSRPFVLICFDHHPYLLTLHSTDKANFAKLEKILQVQKIEAERSLEQARLEQARLHETEVQRLQRNFEERLNEQANARNARRRPINNYRRWISRYWYCAYCKRAAAKPGPWTCSTCDTDYVNKLKGPRS
jgi:GTPase SAR1 family protein